MELVVKLPEGKRPFIGVYYDDAFDAKSKNADLIEEHKNNDWQVILEFNSGNAKLKLISEYAQMVRVYPDLKFDADKLRMWFNTTKESKEFNFSQIHSENGKHVVAKTFKTQKLFVLKLNSCIIWER